MSVPKAESIFSNHWRPQQQGMAKYAQFVHLIQSAVESGDLAPESMLPTEAEFAKATSFSVGTVQRAMQILVSRGVIERRQGVGTFVSRRARRLNEPLQCRIYDDDFVGFLPVYAHVVRRAEIVERGPWTRYLGEHLGRVLLIERILRVEDEFQVLSSFYLDPDRLGALGHIPVNKLHGTNFRALLDREFGLAVSVFDHNIRVETFEPRVNELLELKPGTTGAVLEAIARSELGMPLYFQELYVPPNRRTLHLSGQHGDVAGWRAPARPDAREAGRPAKR